MRGIRFNVASLEKARASAGLMKGELCIKAGVATSTGARAFRGRRVDVATAKKLAAALGFSLPVLVGEPHHSFFCPECSTSDRRSV